MALLAVLLAAAVATFARPAAEVDGRTRLALEASLAAEALARDLSGYLADNSGVPGTLTQYQFSNWFPHRTARCCFSIIRGPSPAPLSVIVTYQQQNYGLVRTLSNAVQSVVVASHVTGFNASFAIRRNPEPGAATLRSRSPSPIPTRRARARVTPISRAPMF